MAEAIKAPAGRPEGSAARVRRDVSEMLLRIERGGDRVVREYSATLDGWDPPSFLVEPDGPTAGSLSDELRTHIDFALAQVRAFARAQRRDADGPADRAAARASCSATGTSRSTRSARTSRAAAIRCSRPRS